jgi:hypothetical protein
MWELKLIPKYFRHILLVHLSLTTLDDYNWSYWKLLKHILFSFISKYEIIESTSNGISCFIMVLEKDIIHKKVTIKHLYLDRSYVKLSELILALKNILYNLRMRSFHIVSIEVEAKDQLMKALFVDELQFKMDNQANLRNKIMGINNLTTHLIKSTYDAS